MKRARTVTGEFLNSLGAGAFIGAYVMIALAAPVAFRLIVSRLEAGSLVSQLLERFSILSYACIGAMILGRILSWPPSRGQGSRLLRLSQVAALAAMTVVALYLGLVLAPNMSLLLAEASVGSSGELVGQAGQTFAELHVRYVALGNVNLVLAVILLVLSTLDLVRRTEGKPPIGAD